MTLKLRTLIIIVITIAISFAVTNCYSQNKNNKKTGKEIEKAVDNTLDAVDDILDILGGKTPKKKKQPRSDKTKETNGNSNSKKTKEAKESKKDNDIVDSYNGPDGALRKELTEFVSLCPWGRDYDNQNVRNMQVSIVEKDANNNPTLIRGTYLLKVYGGGGERWIELYKDNNLPYCIICSSEPDEFVTPKIKNKTYGFDEYNSTEKAKLLSLQNKLRARKNSALKIEKEKKVSTSKTIKHVGKSLNELTYFTKKCLSEYFYGNLNVVDEESLKITVLSKSASGMPTKVKGDFTYVNANYRNKHIKEWVVILFDEGFPYVLYFSENQHMGALYDNGFKFLTPNALFEPLDEVFTPSEIARLTKLHDKFRNQYKVDLQARNLKRIAELQSLQKRKYTNLATSQNLQKSTMQVDVSYEYMANETMIDGKGNDIDVQRKRTGTRSETVDALQNVSNRKIVLLGLYKHSYWETPNDILYEDASIVLEPYQKIKFVEIQRYFDDSNADKEEKHYYFLIR